MKKLYFHFSSLFLIFCGTLFSQNYSGGSGTSNDPFLISNKNDFIYFSNNYTTGVIYFEQTSDLVFDSTDFQAGGIAYNSGGGFKPIAEGSIFNGVYDGKGHKIKNLILNRTAYNPTGLFYELNAAIINDLILENCSFQITNPSPSEVGFLAGKITNGSKVENVGVLNSTINFYSPLNDQESKLGGIVGLSKNNSIIEDCYVNGITMSANVYDNTYFGGICCTADSTTIRRCTAKGISISNSAATSNKIGGIAASVSNGTIEYCYAELGNTPRAFLGGIASTVENTNILNDKAYVNCINDGWSGGLISTAYGGGFISNSSASGALSGTGDFLGGGLIGIAQSGITISKCYSTVDITILQASSTYSPSVGGLCVTLSASTCEESFCTGNLGLAPGAVYYKMGGAFGTVDQNSIVRNCYSRGNVIGYPFDEFAINITAGFIGEIKSGSSVTNCYSTGIVSGGFNDGFIQNNSGGVVSNCFWDTQTSTTTTSIGGGTGESTANMLMESTFTNASWDFIGESSNGTSDIWKMDAPCYVNDGYPIFAWQNLTIDSVKSSSICNSGSLNLNAYGSFGNLYWYDQASGGNLLDSSFSFHTPIISTTTPYYAVMEYNGCVSAVESVDAIVNALPNVYAGLNQTICLGDSILFSGTGALNYEWSNGIIDNDFFIPPSGVNEYYVTGTDTNGCSNTDTVSVTVNNYPNSTLSVLNNGTTLQANDSIATYQWLDCNNSMTPISGENGQSFNPGANGNYALELSLNGCVDTSICTTIAAIGVNENVMEDWFKVYPSVTNGPFTIQFDKVQEFTTVKIYTITGQLIDSKTIQNEKNIQIELNQSSGVYYIEINDFKSKRSISKIIKQ